MSTSKDVIEWRKRTKNRIIEAFGGGCGICGYNRCNRSLDLHHINAETKYFDLSHVIANCKSWNKIVIELRKCVLLCRNCHGEYHDNLFEIPNDITRFNEKYADYKILEKIDEDKNLNDDCPVCGKRKLKALYTCSWKCSFKNKKVDWSIVDFDDLRNNKKMKMQEIADYFGVSRGTIYKRFIKIFNKVSWSS